MNLHQTLFGFCSVAFLIFSASGFCQTGLSNARSFGMSGAYTALASGVDAGRWNPANLGLRHAPKFSFHLASFGAGAYNNAFSKGDYDLYNGAYLAASAKTRILARIPAEGWRFNFAGEMDLIGFSYRHYAVTIGVDFASDARLSRDFIDLLLYGNKLNRRYDFSGTTGNGAAMLTAGFSYGHSLNPAWLKNRVQELAIGATIKYVRGLSTAEVTKAHGSMTTRLEGVFGDAQTIVRRANGGNGLAVDFGAAAVVNKNFSLGLSLRNFPGFIYWNNGGREEEYGARADSLTAALWASADEDSVIQHHSKKRKLSGFSNRLPAVIHAGAAYHQGRLLLSGELVQGLQNQWGASTTPELRLGAEGHFTKYLQPRVGLSLGGLRGFSSAIGVGLIAGVFQADFAAGTWNGILPTTGKGIALAFGMKLEFGSIASNLPTKPEPRKRRRVSSTRSGQQQ